MDVKKNRQSLCWSFGNALTDKRSRHINMHVYISVLVYYYRAYVQLRANPFTRRSCRLCVAYVGIGPRAFIMASIRVRGVR